MVLLTQKLEKRLTINTVEISEDTTAIRSLDWDRDRFDIEFGLQNGTTYNSFLIRGEKIALVDTSHEKFRQLYFDTLTGLINPQDIDYLIVSHTEPDHSGLVKDLLQRPTNSRNSCNSLTLAKSTISTATPVFVIPFAIDWAMRSPKPYSET